MSYTNNPNIPKVRAEAVALVRQGFSTRKVARHFGFSHSAVVKWCSRASQYNPRTIPTRSSRPKVSPLALPREIVTTIVKECGIAASSLHLLVHLVFLWVFFHSCLIHDVFSGNYSNA